MPSFPTTVSIGDPQPDDDIALAEYRPHQHGGPVHLINACINQTRDPRGGLFNQDRRGLALTVASGGQMQVSREGWQAPGRRNAADAQHLGRRLRGGDRAGPRLPDARRHRRARHVCRSASGLLVGRHDPDQGNDEEVGAPCEVDRPDPGNVRRLSRHRPAGLVPYRWRALREHGRLCPPRRARRGHRAGRLRGRSEVRLRRCREPGAQGPHRPAGRHPVPSTAATTEPEVSGADTARREISARATRARPTRTGRTSWTRSAP